MWSRRSDDARYGPRGFAAGVDAGLWRAIRHYFDPSEFRQPEKMDRAFLLRLTEARRLTATVPDAPARGVPFRIVSDYRDPEKNAAVGGVPRSAHTELPCAAVDLRVISSYERFAVVWSLLRAGFERVILEAPTPRQLELWGPSSGTVHVDDSPRLPRPVLALDCRG